MHPIDRRSATWNTAAGEWTATLPNGEVLWWSDAKSLTARVALAHQYGLTGVARIPELVTRLVGVAEKVRKAGGVPS